MASAEQFVRDFLATLVARDIDGLIERCTEDVVYANVPVPAHHGRAAMREFLSLDMKAAGQVAGPGIGELFK